MTRDEAKQLLPIIQAFADGKTVQRMDWYEDKWVDLGPRITFDAGGKYRIKPEPVECWAVVDGTGDVVISYRQQYSAEKYSALYGEGGYRVIRMVEA